MARHWEIQNVSRKHKNDGKEKLMIKSYRNFSKERLQTVIHNHDYDRGISSIVGVLTFSERPIAPGTSKGNDSHDCWC